MKNNVNIDINFENNSYEIIFDLLSEKKTNKLEIVSSKFDNIISFSYSLKLLYTVKKNSGLLSILNSRTSLI